MNSNKTQTNYNNESNSITMNLENLRKQYSNILIQYKQSVTDYINYLKVHNFIFFFEIYYDQWLVLSDKFF